MPTAPTFPVLPATVKTYKSQRAAKMAVTKADKALDLAMANRGTDAMHTARPVGCTLAAQVGTYIHEAWANLQATITTAKGQGFNTSSPWATYFARNAAHMAG